MAPHMLAVLAAAAVALHYGCPPRAAAKEARSAATWAKIGSKIDPEADRPNVPSHPYAGATKNITRSDAAELLGKVKKYISGGSGVEDYQVETLACHGCILSARELRASLGRRARNKYTGKERWNREQGVRQGIAGACERSRYPEEMARANPHKTEPSIFEYKEKSEADAIGFWFGGGHVADEVVGICKLITGKLTPDIVELALYSNWSKVKLYNIDFEKWICKEILQACDDDWFPKARKFRRDDEDFPDDDEDEEL